MILLDDVVEIRQVIGIDRDRVPAPSVWCELFQELDVTARRCCTDRLRLPARA
jgi:hypothetical protein